LIFAQKTDTILTIREGGYMKGLKTQEEFSAYIGNLDRLRWEFFRESSKYKKDWQQCIKLGKKEAENRYSKKSLPVVVGSNVATFFLKSRVGTAHISTELWLRYSIHAAVNPALTYDEAIKIFRAAQKENRFLFYSNMNEYAIFDGIFENINYDETPFVKISVNITLPIDLLVKVFRGFAVEKKEMFLRSHYLSDVPGRRWILPKNIHFEALEDALRHYRMYVHEGISYNEIARRLATEFEQKVGKVHEDDDPEARYFSIVKKNIPKAKRIIRHVEKGMFP
jgi:hypothetical protein